MADACPNSVGDLLATLSACADSMEVTVKDAEPDFMALSGGLQSVYSDVKKLTNQTLESVKLIGGESEQGVLAGVRALARGSLSELKGCHREVAARLPLINRNVEHLRELCGICTVAKKIAMFLRVVGLNVDIESSRSEESRDMFSVVAQEIKQLSGSITGIVQRIREDSRVAWEGQQAAQGEISGALERLLRLTDTAEQTVEKAVLEIEGLMGISLDVLEQAGAHAKEITRQVGEIVVSIQYHDSMRQRIQHIAGALLEVKKICSDTDPGIALHEIKGESLNSAFLILDLQRTQLKQIISEVDGIYEKSRQAFGEITNEVGRLAHSLSAFGTEDSQAPRDPGRGTEDPFLTLKSTLQHLNRLFGQGRDLFGLLQKTVTQAAGTTARVSDHTRQVSGIVFDTHLMALNTIVKAAHIGEKGRALVVLAQEVRNLSEQSNLFVADVEKIIASITSSAGELEGRTLEAGGGKGLGDMGTFSLDDASLEISGVYARFKEESASEFHGARAVQDIVAKISSGLDFLPALTVSLKEHLLELDRIADALSPWSGSGREDSTGVAHKLAETYTMQLEREIHERHIDGAIATDEEGGREFGPESEDGEDLGDNVELF